MDEQKIEQIKELAVQQINGLISLGGKDIEGSSLELQLRLFVSGLQGLDLPAAPQRITQGGSLSELLNQRIAAEGAAPDPYGEYDEYEDDWEDEGEIEPLPVPEGFADEEAYQAFLNDQLDNVNSTFINIETGEETTLRPEDVSGVVASENGYEEVGDFNGSLDKITDYLIETNTIYDEETGDPLVVNEVDEVPSVTIVFERLDGNELTEANLTTIFAHPVSQPMVRVFGQDFDIVAGDEDAVKNVVFRIDQDSDESRRAAQGLAFSNGAMQFGGRAPFPGIGMVQSKVVF